MKRGLYFDLAKAVLVITMMFTGAMLQASAQPMEQASAHDAIDSLLLSLNQQDFKGATNYVVNAEPKAGFKDMEQMLKGLKASYSLKKISLKIYGNAALADVEVTTKGLPSGEFTSKETLLLRKEQGAWKVVPGDRYRVDVTKPNKVLLQVVTLLAHPEDYTGTASDSEAKTAQARMLQLASALSSLIEQRQQAFVLTSETFQDSLSPFVKSQDAFTDPQVGEGKISYSFNPILEGILLTAIPNGKEVVAIYEGVDGVLDFRHSGISYVVTVDNRGHFAVRAVTKEAADSLNWQL